MTALESIRSKIKDIAEKRAAALAEIRKEFPEIIKPIFAELGIESVSWRQYTPYFNDGDECEFGVRNDHDSISIDGKDYYDDDNYKKEEDRFKKVAAVLQSVPDEFYKDLFGDHSEITVKADGTIETEQYEHD